METGKWQTLKNIKQGWCSVNINYDKIRLAYSRKR